MPYPQDMASLRSAGGRGGGASSSKRQKSADGGRAAAGAPQNGAAAAAAGGAGAAPSAAGGSSKRPLPATGDSDDEDDDDAAAAGASAAGAAASAAAAEPVVLSSTSKLNALLAELAAMRAADPGNKALVFSQFTTTIEWLKQKLPEQGFGFRTISGSMARYRFASVGIPLSEISSFMHALASAPAHADVTASDPCLRAFTFRSR